MFTRRQCRGSVCFYTCIHVSLFFYQVITVRTLSQNTSFSHHNILLSRHKSWCMVEVVAGSMSHSSILLDFTLAGDLVTQQVARVQIETNSAFLHSWHPESSIQEQQLFLYCRINWASSFFIVHRWERFRVCSATSHFSHRDFTGIAFEPAALWAKIPSV